MKPGKTFLPRFVFFCLLLTALSVHARAEYFSASVDRTDLSINESLTLTLSYSGQTLDSPDLSVLKKDFEILSQQRQSQLALGFGSDSSRTEWVLALAPRKTGKLNIPPISFQGQTTNQIPISVSEASNKPGVQDNIFIETEIDRENTYIQSQVILTLRLNTAVMLRGVDMSDLTIPNARVLKAHDAQYRKSINGREYIVVEMKYAIFPETEGTLTIPQVTFTGIVPSRNDPFGSSSLFGPRGNQVRFRSQAKTIKVLPIPETARNQPWIPAKGLSLSQKWSRKPEEIKVGEPITRTITVTAQGLTGAQIPPLDSDEVPNLKRYPDQPELTETLSEQGVLGVRSEAVALVPTEAGRIELPPVIVNWWDTESNRMQQTRLDAVALDVLPAEQTSQPVNGDTEQDNPIGDIGTPSTSFAMNWFYVSLVGNLILAITLIYMLFRRQGDPGLTKESKAQNEKVPSGEDEVFRKLMRMSESEPIKFREQLLKWASLFWPEIRISTLSDISRLCENEKLAELFTRMDKNLYGSGSSENVDIRDIKDNIKAIRKRWKADGKNFNALSPLYPVPDR